MDIPRYNVLGVGVHELNLDRATEVLIAGRERRQRGYVCITGVHGVIEAQDDPSFRTILNDALLVTPDGMPLVWRAWLGGRREVGRVYGPDLMLALCDAGRAVGLRHYFYGGNEGVAEELSARLQARYPGLEVAGTYTPPFRPLEPGELAALQADVARTQPHVFWVGLSTPKQERFMAAHLSQLDVGVMIGVGAAFDFHSGRITQAPRWMQRSGLEWLYRITREPRRLGPRYLRSNPRFLGLIALQLLGLRKYPLGVLARER